MDTRRVAHRMLATLALQAVVLLAVACTQSGASTATPSATASPTQTAPATVETVRAADATPRATATSTQKAPIDRIAIASLDGAIYTVRPDGTDHRRVTPGDPGIPAGPLTVYYTWPFWSPDGDHLLITAFTPDVAGGFETSLLRTSSSSDASIPELVYLDVPGTTGIGGIPHFPLWHPDGGSVAVIANVGEGLSTFIVDVEDGIGPTVSNGAPVYLDWSHDGAYLLVHTAETLVLHSFDETGKRTGFERIGTGSISYRVPGFAGESERFAYIDSVDGERFLFLSSPSDTEPRRLRPAAGLSALAWSPDGSRLAMAADGSAGVHRSLRIIAPDAPAASDVLVVTELTAFWWAPDGNKLLVIAPGDSPDNVVISTVDARSGAVTALGQFAPSPELAFVITYFDQYASGLNLWSPDSTRFILGGMPAEGLRENTGIPIQLGGPDSEVWVIDASGVEPPISLGSGGIGSWSPN